MDEDGKGADRPGRAEAGDRVEQHAVVDIVHLWMGETRPEGISEKKAKHDTGMCGGARDVWRRCARDLP